MRAASRLMTVLFLIAAALQYNDPDPLRWIAIYGLAALASVLAVVGWLPRAAPILVGLAAASWALTLAPGVVGRVSPGELFESYAMKSAPVEEAREMGGLFLVALWMAILVFWGGRRPAQGRSLGR